MDPVTHMLTGACVSRAGLNRKTALATLTLVLAFEAPDIDSVTYFWGGITGLEHHRGITHSLIGAPFLALAVVALVYGIHRWRNTRQKTGAESASVGALPKLAPNWKLLYGYALLGALVTCSRTSPTITACARSRHSMKNGTRGTSFLLSIPLCCWPCFLRWCCRD